MAIAERVEGKTIFGSANSGPNGVSVNSKVGKVGYISLVNAFGNEYFLWFNSTGILMTASTVPADPDLDGTPVGSQ